MIAFTGRIGLFTEIHFCDFSQRDAFFRDCMVTAARLVLLQRKPEEMTHIENVCRRPPVPANPEICREPLLPRHLEEAAGNALPDNVVNLGKTDH